MMNIDKRAVTTDQLVINEIFKRIDVVFNAEGLGASQKLSEIYNLCDDARLFRTWEQWVLSNGRRPSKQVRHALRKQAAQ
jgi:hypothetical protein